MSANSKAISEAIKTISDPRKGTHKDKTVYLFAADAATDGKVVHGCYVSEEARGKGADAVKWSSEVAGVVGGKAGGKGATSLGQGTKVESVDEGVKVAMQYLEQLKL